MKAYEFEVIDAALKASANRYKVESEAEKNIETAMILTYGRLAIEAARTDLYNAFLANGIKVEAAE